MMQSVRIAAATLLLAALPSMAWAECGWVLWTEFTFVNLKDRSPLDRRLQPEAGFPSYQVCLEAGRKLAENMAESSAPNVKQSKLGTLFVGGYQVDTEFKEPPLSSMMVTYRCFPDTVRPR